MANQSWRSLSPQGDYASLVISDDGSDVMYYSNSPHWRAPLRQYVLSAIPIGQWASWTPPSSFASITDGLSNQFLIGEKFISADKIGKAAEDGNSYLYGWDGNYWAKSGSATPTYWRYAYLTGKTAYIAKNPYDLNGALNAHSNLLPSLGGAHAGIATFLLADGSVHSVSATIKQIESSMLTATRCIRVFSVLCLMLMMVVVARSRYRNNSNYSVQ
ncbi:MAG: DUF1559 domain-containing protein [Planctomycetaceae bacterium]|nr:DUF1559 domain-containing protein [Planctomycetaceae bacterium]